jgi:uncharacterized membrane protein
MTAQPFTIPALLFLIVSIPLALDLVPRNRFYGFRTRKTLSDDAIWYAANRFGARALMVSSLVYLLLSALLPYDKNRQDNFSVWAVHLASFVIPLAVGVFVTWRHTRRL